MPAPTAATWPAALAVCVGASAGALLRWRLSAWLNPLHAWLPLGTLLANWSAALLIGLAVGAIMHWNIGDPWRALVITGFLGALSTLSTFSIEVLGLLLTHRPWHAALLMVLHIGGCLLLAWAGMSCFPNRVFS